MELRELLERNLRVFNAIDAEVEDLRRLRDETMEIVGYPMELKRLGDKVILHTNTALTDGAKLTRAARRGQPPSNLDLTLKIVKHLF